MDLDFKKEKLIKLFVYFQRKYDLECSFSFSKYGGTYFEVHRNNLNIDLVDIENHNIESLAWILAHECRHAMQFQHKLLDDIIYQSSKIYLKNRENVFYLLLITSLLLIFKSDVSIIQHIAILFGLYVFIGSRLIYTRKYLKLRRKMEEDADEFANKAVGTGAFVFLHYLSPQNKNTRKWRKLFFGAGPQDVHPNPYDRMKEAAKYRMNPEIMAILE